MSGRQYFRPYLAIAAVCVIALAIPNFQRDQDWVSVYLPAAARLAEGQDIFGQGFVYPPINALLALPFLAFARVPGLLVWHALNMAALGVLILGAWKLAGGPRLDGNPAASWRDHAAFWLGLLCGISSCIDAITNQQTDIIVAAVVVLGCLALSQQRDVRAGWWFGLAAAIKCTPLLWAPYLAWRRRWAAALLVVVASVGFNFLPDLAFPKEDSSSRAVEWPRRFLVPMSEREVDYGTWACGVGGNQSIAGLCQRCLVYDTYWQGDLLCGKVRETRASPETLKAVAWTLMFLLLAVAVACAWRAPVDAPLPVGQPATPALHFGIVVILMVLLSPHSSKPHFCTLLLPGFCLARVALNEARRGLLTLLVIAIALALASNMDLVGEWLYSWSKWYGSLPGAALLLMAGISHLLWTRGIQTSPATSVMPAPTLLPFPSNLSSRAA